jgi:hypothetical protein
MTVEEAAKILEASNCRMTPQLIRLGLQQNRLPFGVAIKTSPNRWTYKIIDKKVYEFAGMSEPKPSRARASIGDFAMANKTV